MSGSASAIGPLVSTPSPIAPHAMARHQILLSSLLVSGIPCPLSVAPRCVPPPSMDSKNPITDTTTQNINALSKMTVREYASMNGVAAVATMATHAACRP